MNVFHRVDSRRIIRRDGDGSHGGKRKREPVRRVSKEGRRQMIWIIIAADTFLVITALRGLWNLIERVDNLQDWYETLIGRKARVEDFDLDELGRIIREERRRT